MRSKKIDAAVDAQRRRLSPRERNSFVEILTIPDSMISEWLTELAEGLPRSKNRAVTIEKQTFVVLGVADAVTLLQGTTANIGHAVVAEYLSSRPASSRSRDIITLSLHWITLEAIDRRNNKVVYIASTQLPSVPHQNDWDGGPYSPPYNVQLNDGVVATVNGPDDELTGRTAVLVSLAGSRQFPGDPNSAFQFPLSPFLMREILLMEEEETPGILGWTIRALYQVSPSSCERLLSDLGPDDKLYSIAARVMHDLPAPATKPSATTGENQRARTRRAR